MRERFIWPDSSLLCVLLCARQSKEAHRKGGKKEGKHMHMREHMRVHLVRKRKDMGQDGVALLATIESSDLRGTPCDRRMRGGCAPDSVQMRVH